MSKQTAQIDEQSMDAAKARALLQEENKARSQACMAEIQKTLEKYQCSLQFIAVQVNGQTHQAAFQAVPIDSTK